MKRYIQKTLSIILGIGVLLGCEDLKFGENFLEKKLSDDVNVDSVFAHKKYADQMLNQFYKSLPDFLGSYSGGPRVDASTLDVFSVKTFAAPRSRTFPLPRTICIICKP